MINLRIEESAAGLVLELLRCVQSGALTPGQASLLEQLKALDLPILPETTPCRWDSEHNQHLRPHLSTVEFAQWCNKEYGWDEPISEDLL